MAVQGEKIEHVAEIHVRRGPQRDDRREAELPGSRPIEHGGAHRPRLGYQGHVATPCQLVTHGGIQPKLRPHHPKGVRPEDPDPVAPCRLHQLVLQRSPSLPLFPEARRIDHRRLDPVLAALINYFGDFVGGGGNEGQLHVFAHVRERLVTGPIRHLLVLWIDRVTGTLETSRQEIAVDHAPGGSVPVARAKYSHAAWDEELVDVGQTHRLCLRAEWGLNRDGALEPSGRHGPRGMQLASNGHGDNTRASGISLPLCRVWPGLSGLAVPTSGSRTKLIESTDSRPSVEHAQSP